MAKKQTIVYKIRQEDGGRRPLLFLPVRADFVAAGRLSCKTGEGYDLRFCYKNGKMAVRMLARAAGHIYIEKVELFGQNIQKCVRGVESIKI